MEDEVNVACVHCGLRDDIRELCVGGRVFQACLTCVPVDTVLCSEIVDTAAGAIGRCVGAVPPGVLRMHNCVVVLYTEVVGTTPRAKCPMDVFVVGLPPECRIDGMPSLEYVTVTSGARLAVNNSQYHPCSSMAMVRVLQFLGHYAPSPRRISGLEYAKIGVVRRMCDGSSVLRHTVSFMPPVKCTVLCTIVIERVG